MPQSIRSPHRGVVSIARYCARSYTLDYFALALLMTGYFVIVFFVEPFHRMFFINNMNLMFPHALVERVPVTMNMFYSGIIPLIILLIWLGMSRSSAHKVHVTVLGFLISLALTVFTTDVIKNAVGRPRPDLIARCKPAPRTPDNVLVTIDVCTETNHHLLHDGWRSFPSGHSSFAFGGLGFLSLFFAGQMQIFRPRTDLSRALLSFAPLISATLIAISRCEDYRHDVYDVVCGSIIGLIMAYFSYRRYYPRLHSLNCNEPLISRDASYSDAFGKAKDDVETARSTRILKSSDIEDTE